jgi:signal transduction histidine kinase
MSRGLESALARLGNEPFDLVLLDILMEGLSGLDTLERLRRLRGRGELAVIMVTGNRNSRDIVRAFELGADDYVTKPVDLAVLGARVRTQLEMLRLSRLKEQFLAIASHDLKNPLSTIALAVDLLDENIPVGAVMTDRMHSVVQGIRRSAMRMKGIVEDFVDGQALQEGRLELSLLATDLNKLALRASADYGAAAAAKKLDLQLELDPTLPSVLADERRAMQLIENLLGNAIKFSNPGCPITLRTHAEEATALFEVCDTGPGLSDSDLKGLFVRYARLSNAPTGGEKSSGLGLAICRQLVELHRGQLGARNNPGGGSTFWFRLPFGGPPSCVAPPAAAAV